MLVSLIRLYFVLYLCTLRIYVAFRGYHINTYIVLQFYAVLSNLLIFFAVVSVHFELMLFLVVLSSNNLHTVAVCAELF